MNDRKDFIEYETVLTYCINKTMGGYDDAARPSVRKARHALAFGKLSGFFTPDNKLTPIGKTIAQYVDDGLAA
jgi:hypothetical protein